MAKGKHATKSANRRQHVAEESATAAAAEASRLRQELRNRNESDLGLAQAVAEITRLRQQRTDETSDQLQKAEAERDAAAAKAEQDLDELAELLRDLLPLIHGLSPPEKARRWGQLNRILGDGRIAGLMPDAPRSSRRAFRGGNVEGRLNEAYRNNPPTEENP